MTKQNKRQRVTSVRRDAPTRIHVPADLPTGEAAAGSFPIVGIGASAGGLEAFIELLRHLPLDTGMGFVLVQHLDPQHESALAQLLGRATSLPVQEVTDKLRVEPNHVYVIPPNAGLVIVRGILKLNPRSQARTPVRSIDVFFESLAQDQRERAIGVILSGTATDGTLGLEAIKAEGGMTFAQDESARYDSMPRSAVAAGCVDFVLSPQHIAQELARIATHLHVAGDDATATEEIAGGQGGHAAPRGPQGGFGNIVRLLHNHCGVDFSLYKASTIRRRIARRMVLEKQVTLESYAQSLRDSPGKLDALYSDVLISVTSFFRNPEAFDALKRRIFPKLLAQRGDKPIRVWVLGCSTGQEAYSIAIAFMEASERASRTRKLQIFATDLNEALLDKARRGLYAKSLTHDVSAERLRRFFVEEEGGYRVGKALREMVVFARQDLISNPPFSRMDLISCRNLLIYLEQSLQKKALPTFHYALKPGGFLFLGASESIGSFTDLFEAVDKAHRIYSRKSAPAGALDLPVREGRNRQPTPGSRKPLPPVRPDMKEVESGELSAQREADRVTVNQFAPPGVLVNADLQILQFRGSTGAYLESPTGKVTFDLLKMAREALMLPLRAAINKARKDNRTVRKENVRMQQSGTARLVNIKVIPLRNLRERCFLILFENAAGMQRADAGAALPTPVGRRGGGKEAGAPAKRESRRATELASELAETRDYLQSVREQNEAASEELQASNEEVQSANEELQSINEELETSKEELESANEELVTVNEEMANRNAELNRANSDLQNLQTSTRMTIVLLGRDLTIRRFSAQAERQFELTASDVGRRIGSVHHHLVFDAGDLEPFIADVIDTGREREREVTDRDGRWYSLRVRPYLTLDNKVDGAVLVLVDIDALKRNEQAISEARDFAQAVVRTVRDPLLILSADLRVHSANNAFYDTFKISPAEAEGRSIYALVDGQWDVPRLRELLEDILPRHSVFDNFEVTQTFAGASSRTILLNARALGGSDGRPERILLGTVDVTEQLQFQGELHRSHEALRESEERFRTLFEAAPMAIFVCDRDAVIQFYNRRATELWGREPARGAERFCGSVKLWLPDGKLLPHERSPIADVLRTGVPQRNVEVLIERPDGSRLPVLANFAPMLNARGEITGAITSFVDFTEQKDTANALQRVSNELVDADRHKNEFLATLAHELRNPLAPIRNALAIIRRTTQDTGATVQPAVEMMERQVAQLVRLVDDLLDVSRISHGHIELRRERIELASVVHHAVEAARPLLDGMEHDLTVTLPPEAIYVHADASRLAQVVGNLLNNAGKFTDRGGRIALIVECDGRQAVIRVRDNGIGIAPEQLPRIFDMFAQVDTTIERSTTGLGIGLSLVRQLLELHGGTVEARSAGIGRGSEFTVRLPQSEAPAQSVLREAPRAPAALAASRILVVDDNRDAADSVATLLELAGNDVRTAYDGIQALEIAEAVRPDVMLLDIGLPKLNGYQVARRIREQPWGKRIALVALTGWGQNEDREKSRESGFDTHLVKPVDPNVLLKLLSELSPAPA